MGFRASLVLSSVFATTACGGQSVIPPSELGLPEGGSGVVDASPGWEADLGVYPDCGFANLGFATGMGGTLTLAQDTSGTLTATYGDGEAGAVLSFSLRFVPTSSSSATLAPAGQTIPSEALCWAGAVVTDAGGIIDPAPTAVTLAVTSGALTYDAQTLHLSFVGTRETDAACEGATVGTLLCARK